MKRFFHKFSSTGDRGGTESSSLLKEKSSSVDLSDQQNILEGLPARPRQSNGGDRVRSLAARFESLGANDNKQQRKDVFPPPLKKSSLAPTSQPAQNKENILGTESRATTMAARDTLTPFPDVNEDSSILGSAASNDDSTSNRQEAAQGGMEQQAEQQSSHSANTPSREDVTSATDLENNDPIRPAQHCNTKTVVFAPSPEKPVRSASPRLGNPDDTQQSPTSSSIIAHFAMPTAASSARMKNAAKHRSADMITTSSISRLIPSGPASVESSQLTRPSSSLSNTRPSVRRTISASGPGRPHATDSSYCTKSAILSSFIQSNGSKSPTMTRAMSSNASLRPSQEDKRFSSPRNGSLITIDRCASPQSVGPASYRTNGSLSPQGLDSRRSSWAGRTDSPGSMIFNWSSNGARSIGGPSWSEMTQEELVNNLGARERTRQEVLWEIVASEERYVNDLQRTKELYLDPLLHPLEISQSRNGCRSPVKSPSTPVAGPSMQRLGSTSDGRSGMSDSAQFINGNLDAAVHLDRHVDESHREEQTPTKRPSVHSMTPLSPASTPRALGSNSIGKIATKESRRWSSGKMTGKNNSETYAIPLSASLQIAMKAISNGLLEAHSLLSETLKLRYEEQWPLVRSLADIFAQHDQIWQHYTDYVLHLERALDTLEEAALMERAMRGKKFKADKLPSSVALGRAIATLESAALEQGECSLSIFLAMPFQRLLKYPLLFQNLLFHTDASTYEFESTVKMVVDVERIVRSIEDEKADKEERDKVIDAFARIEGIKDKALLRPKRNRILMEEKALYEENPKRANSDTKDHQMSSQSQDVTKEHPLSLDSHQASMLASSPSSLKSALKDKRSYRRLSDFLTVDDRQKATKAPNMGSKRDLWTLRFSDVEIKCQRVGVTALPMVSSVALQKPQNDQQTRHQTEDVDAVEASTGVIEEEIRIKEDFKRSKESKERMSALRSTTLRSKTRNLYKFISVTSWKQVEKRESRELSVLLGLTSPKEVDEEDIEDDDVDDDHDDRSSRTSLETDVGVLDPERYIRQSKLSFSYWGQDRVEPKVARETTPIIPQSQYSRSVHVDDGDKLKRHSYTPTNLDVTTAPIATFKSAHISSKVVLSNAHAGSKANKFGNRLRTTGDGPYILKEQSRNMLSRMKAEEPVMKENESRLAIHKYEAESESRGGESESHGMEEGNRGNHDSIRFNLSRDQSIDSNLKFMRALIDEGGEQRAWR